MKVSLKQSDYPRYFKDDGKLLAFVSKDKMYKIEAIGSNKNPGITIDHYITRNMVIRHWPLNAWQKELTKTEFKTLLQRLYGAYIEKIVE